MTPAASEGRAVVFNVEWKDCHEFPELVGEEGYPKTCGELRERVARGKTLMVPSSVGGGALFSGNDPTQLNAGFGIATFPASAYNDLWKSWGMNQRPDNFDELVSQRYGAPFGHEPNPYPLPGEDPNATNGGSGKLPYFFTHLREKDGNWTGKIGITCQGCHSGEVGTSADGDGLGFTEGSGSPLADHNLFLYDMQPRGYLASLVTFINLNQTRGVNNASDINLAFIFPDEGQVYSLSTLFGIIVSGSSAGIDTPAWWNMGHRAAKFQDGVFPMDAPRVDMVFYTPFFGLFGGVLGPISESGQEWMREHGTAANDWAQVLKSPKYPGNVDTALAEEGAVLFHELDLWEPSRNNPVREPDRGNGSCASCHGAYAPRYFNDPSYLASPTLEGQAAYITPAEIIGTDEVRMDVNNEAVQRAGAENFFGYPELDGTGTYCGPQNLASVRGDRELGYLTPPLYGVWATAPYLHNGSVPTLWEVLKPSERKNVWRRRSTPTPGGQEGKVVMGFDTSLDRAYDHDKVGWLYTTIECESPSILNPNPSPHLRCDADGFFQNLVEQATTLLQSNFILAWNLLYPPLDTQDLEAVENRKTYNTNMFGQGNQGHEFNDVLTDAERWAIIEYLKTL